MIYKRHYFLTSQSSFARIHMVSNIATFYLHTVKWFQVLLFIVCSHLNLFEHCYLLFAHVELTGHVRYVGGKQYVYLSLKVNKTW